MKLMADVIDLAINEYLREGKSDRVKRTDTASSCCAVALANSSVNAEVHNFLRSMGMRPFSFREFSSIPIGPKRQYARALWLTWAAMIAKEEGKTI